MFLRVYATKVSMDIDIFCDSKGTTIQCKNKVERTKKRTNDHKNKSLISSTFQRNHGGEALLQQRNKQITNEHNRPS